jgi:hypothetical protein
LSSFLGATRLASGSVGGLAADSTKYSEDLDNSQLAGTMCVTAFLSGALEIYR